MLQIRSNFTQLKFCIEINIINIKTKKDEKFKYYSVGLAH